MPASNFPFRAPYGCKLQEISHEIDGKTVKENWLVVSPNIEEGLSDKQKPYCFMADSEIRESSIFFNFACGKQVGDDLYLLASINGEAQSSFEIKIQKKEGEKYVEDTEATKTFFTKWKETGFLTAFHVNGVWNLELLVKAVIQEKVLLKDAVKCLFSKKEIPLELLAKVSDQYSCTLKHLKTGQPPKAAEPEIFEKLKSLNASIGLPSVVLKEIELEDDFGERKPCPAFSGELPDSVEALFSPKASGGYQKKEQKSYGMKPEERMSFLFTNFENKELVDYCQKILNTPDGYMRHLILCQMTGLDVGFPSGLVSSAVHPLYLNTTIPNGNGKHEEKNNYANNLVDSIQQEKENYVDNISTDVEENINTVEDIEETFDYQTYLKEAELPAKEIKKITECIQDCLQKDFVDISLYVKGMEIDGSTTLTKSRNTPEVKNFVCQSFLILYKVLNSETLNKNILRLPAYLLHHFQLNSIEKLSLSQLKDLQAKMSELDKRASLEEVSLAV